MQYQRRIVTRTAVWVVSTTKRKKSEHTRGQTVVPLRGCARFWGVQIPRGTAILFSPPPLPPTALPWRSLSSPPKGNSFGSSVVSSGDHNSRVWTVGAA